MLGTHVNKNDDHIISIKNMINMANEHGIILKAVQFFVMGPNKMKLTHDISEVKELSEYLSGSGLYSIAHSCYLNHVGGSNQKLSSLIISMEIKAIRELGMHGYIIHLPVLSVDKIISILDRIVSLNNIMSHHGPIIYLENNALATSQHNYSNIEDLSQLVNAIPHAYSKYIGVCIDTAHMFSAGIDIGDVTILSKWLDEFDKIKPANVMFALNDQLYELNSGKDEHKTITMGNIWNGRTESLILLLDYCVKNNYLVIMERNSSAVENDFINLNRMGYFSNK